MNAPAYEPNAHAVMPMNGGIFIGSVETRRTVAIYVTAPPPTIWIGALQCAKIAAAIWIDAFVAGWIGVASRIDATNLYLKRSK